MEGLDFRDAKEAGTWGGGMIIERGNREGARWLHTHSSEFISLIINSNLETKELSRGFSSYRVLGRQIGEV